MIYSKTKENERNTWQSAHFSYFCQMNGDSVALHDMMGITEHYACLAVVKPRKLLHDNPDDSVISPMHCVDCYYCISDYGFS